jgi:hypothetical protein
MQMEKFAESWATPPKFVGPLVVAVLVIVICLGAWFARSANFRRQSWCAREVGFFSLPRCSI